MARYAYEYFYRHMVVDTTKFTSERMSLQPGFAHEAVCECDTEAAARQICDALNGNEPSPAYKSARTSFLLSALHDLGVSDVDEKTPVNELYRRLGDALNNRVRRVEDPAAAQLIPGLHIDLRLEHGGVEYRGRSIVEDWSCTPIAHRGLIDAYDALMRDVNRTR